jgi:hypothetical protein
MLPSLPFTCLLALLEALSLLKLPDPKPKVLERLAMTNAASLLARYLFMQLLQIENLYAIISTNISI